MPSTINPYDYTDDLPMVEMAIRSGARLFPELAPHQPRIEELSELADHLDARSRYYAKNRFLEHPTLPAAYAFFGQFVAHDLTFSTTPLRPKRGQVWPESQRTPRLDLDSLYGGGPTLRPELYEEGNPHDRGADRRLRYRFFLPNRGKGKQGLLDVPRNEKGRAVVADPRNDSNVLTSQLHVAFSRFHNRVFDEMGLTEKSSPSQIQTAFREARRLTRWHYQWVVVHDFLKRLVDPHRVDDFLQNGGRRARAIQSLVGWSSGGGESGLPVEFTGAAFRIGHSLLHYEYRLGDGEKKSKTLQQLGGFRELTSGDRVDWNRFLQRAGGDFERCRRLDRFMPNFPVEVNGERITLMELDLRRGADLGLPSGQAIARALGMRSVDPHGDDPLWYYVFKEAELARHGQRLGPVGGLVVAHVFIDVLRRDPDSFLIQNPNWKPTLGEGGERFDLRSFLGYAGLV